MAARYRHKLYCIILDMVKIGQLGAAAPGEHLVSMLFNNIMKSGQVAADWKDANVGVVLVLTIGRLV